MEQLKKKEQVDRFKDLILNDPDLKRRMDIKRLEEMASNESKSRKINAPLSTEEKAILHQQCM
jgi:hypothetical protein